MMDRKALVDIAELNFNLASFGCGRPAECE